MFRSHHCIWSVRAGLKHSVNTSIDVAFTWCVCFPPLRKFRGIAFQTQRCDRNTLQNNIQFLPRTATYRHYYACYRIWQISLKRSIQLAAIHKEWNALVTTEKFQFTIPRRCQGMHADWSSVVTLSYTSEGVGSDLAVGRCWSSSDLGSPQCKMMITQAKTFLSHIRNSLRPLRYALWLCIREFHTSPVGNHTRSEIKQKDQVEDSAIAITTTWL